MGTILIPLIHTLNSGFRTRAVLLAEIMALRHQLAILKQSTKKRPRLGKSDRFLWVELSRWWPDWRNSLLLVKPETVLAWHRKGFRLYWIWKSRRRHPGRPDTTKEIQDLIRTMSTANATWGAPRLHGELLKLGIEVSQATVAKYMTRRGKPPSQTWRTFLENHLKTMVSVDFLVVPTISFRILFVFLVMSHDRRRVLHFNVTAHPTAEWTADQILQAFPWDTAPRYLLRDRDSIYGDSFRRQISSMEIKEVLTAPRSPWQNPYVERVIGSVRRECLNHIIAINEASLRTTLRSYFSYYHDSRCHLALNKDSPEPREIQCPNKGRIVAIPKVGGLHHRYERRAA